MKGYAKDTSEAEFQRAVIGLAEMYGWLVYHTHDSRRSAMGFPDLTMVRGDRVVFAELKKHDGKLSEHQRKWVGALVKAGVETYVWRPADIELIASILGPRGS